LALEERVRAYTSHLYCKNAPAAGTYPHPACDGAVDHFQTIGLEDGALTARTFDGEGGDTFQEIAFGEFVSTPTRHRTAHGETTTCGLNGVSNMAIQLEGEDGHTFPELAFGEFEFTSTLTGERTPQWTSTAGYIGQSTWPRSGSTTSTLSGATTAVTQFDAEDCDALPVIALGEFESTFTGDRLLQWEGTGGLISQPSCAWLDGTIRGSTTSDLCGVSALSMQTNASSRKVATLGSTTVQGPLSVDDPTKTTVIAKNLPATHTREMLTSLLDGAGFWARYDFVYLPVDFSTLRSFGYAIVNFITHDDALRFGNFFHGCCHWVHDEVGPKIAEVEWSSQIQGLQKHIERYRDSPMMHKRVPDGLKPMLFTKGARASFPPPTKSLKMPRRVAQRRKENSTQGSTAACTPLTYNPRTLTVETQDAPWWSEPR
jgi:RNA recognition motif-containing protein